MNFKRTFSMQDQKDFAFFSGDHNPIHLNNNEAIKTHAGQPIVHGVHMAMWALDVLDIDFSEISSIDVNFFLQINLNTEVRAFLDSEINEIHLLTNNNEIHCSIQIIRVSNLKNSSLKNHEVIFTENSLKPDDPRVDQIRLGQKIYDLYGGSKKYLGKNIFPNLVKNLGIDSVYEMACISSIVGMKVPGLHSLFTNFKLTFTNNNKNNYLIVNKKHDVLKVVSMSYFGLNFNADIRALFRPMPAVVSSMLSLKKELKGDISLQDQKVLVIGGSRGIGAYVTKLTAIMGASVTFTYNSQQEEAKLIEKEIICNGGKVQIKKMNVLDQNDLDELSEKFNHIYYFATPKILPNSSKKIDTELEEYFYLFYVDAFEKVVNKFSSLNKNAKFLYPSTTYIDDRNSDYREYINAKLKGEQLCDSFNTKLHKNLFYPRLPPLDTDQNLSILPIKNSKASEYALYVISQMNERLS